MGLDYNGIPKFSRERDLFLNRLDNRDISSFIDEEDKSTFEDRIFDDVARTYLKGEALKEALGEMLKAGFIPVEPTSKVVASLQRLDPAADNYTTITFGMFKEACEYLHGTSTKLNEDFLGSYAVIDPELQDKEIISTHTSSTNDGSDWISAFIAGGSAIAGIMLAGYMADLFNVSVPRATAPSNEVKQWGAQGLLVGVALLIELGLTYLAIQEEFSNSNTLGKEVKDAFSDLDKDPAKRKELLTEAGYDYDLLRKNQEHNDYNAVKNYSIEYIKSLKDQSKYHHWVSYISVISNQGMVKHALAMAPTFSDKWSRFAQDSSEVGLSPEDVEFDALKEAEERTKTTFNNGLKSYISSLVSTTNDTYNNMYAAFNFQLDERVLCCMIYFLGPLESDVFAQMSDILKLFLLRFNIDFNQLLAFLLDETLTSILNIAATYTSKLISEISEQIMDVFFRLPKGDLEAMLKLCIGIDILYRIVDAALRALVEAIEEVFVQLRYAIQMISGKTKAMSFWIAEQRTALTISSMLASIAHKLEEANQICATKTEDKDLPFINNFGAAEAAIEFVSIEMPDLFPVMKMSEENSRKYFRNVPGFQLPSMNIEVPGTDSTGKQLRPLAFSDPVTDCANESNASESIALGRKFAELFKTK